MKIDQLQGNFHFDFQFHGGSTGTVVAVLGYFTILTSTAQTCDTTPVSVPYLCHMGERAGWRVSRPWSRWDTTIEIHRIEMTALSQRTAPGGQSRRVPLWRHWVAPLRWLCTQHMDGRDVLHIFVDNSKTLRNFEFRNHRDDR